MDKEALYTFAVETLQGLIQRPSFSKEEKDTADFLYQTAKSQQLNAHRYLNNIWAISDNFDPQKPCILFNSHHDTVKPNSGYTLDPFTPLIQDDKLYGLGSNDAGASVVSQLAAFTALRQQKDLHFNLIWTATAEEEISGRNGVEALLQSAEFKNTLQNATIIGGIVGEPTQMQMAVAERGLMVLDAVTTGQAGHAANDTGINALYLAHEDIGWFKQKQWAKVSDYLGPVKSTVTSIETPNKAHNIIPDICKYTVDVRLNELYTFEEILTEIQANVHAEIHPRSMRLRSTQISHEHPLVIAGTEIGLSAYGSPTTSDKALIPFPCVKCGPGLSARSHTADEFIYLPEIQEAISIYIQLLTTCNTFFSKK